MMITEVQEQLRYISSGKCKVDDASLQITEENFKYKINKVCILYNGLQISSLMLQKTFKIFCTKQGIKF